MMRVFLIRHAQSENNLLTAETMHLRKADPELTPLGYRQSEQLSRFIAEQTADANTGFQITHLYTSAMYRSLLTAQPLGAALGLDAQVWPDLHETGGMYRHQDSTVIGCTGMTRSAIQREFPDFVLPESVSEQGWYDAAQGIETESHIVNRAMKVAEALSQRSGSDDVLALVSHANFLDFLLKAVFAGSSERNGGGPYYHNNTAITCMNYEGAQPSLEFTNRLDHLPTEMHSY